jgi:hypothetical protein
MENIKEKYDALVDHVKEYVSNRIELAKLMAIEKSALGISNAATYFILAFLMLFFIIFISVTLAIGLSAWLGSGVLGFLIVALIYFFTALILFIKREKWVIEPISNIVIKSALKDYNPEK